MKILFLLSLNHLQFGQQLTPIAQTTILPALAVVVQSNGKCVGPLAICTGNPKAHSSGTAFTVQDLMQ